LARTSIDNLIKRDLLPLLPICPPKGDALSSSPLFYLLTAFLSFSPALKIGTSLAGIFNVAPVCGFLPVLAFLFATLNVPNLQQIHLVRHHFYHSVLR